MQAKIKVTRVPKRGHYDRSTIDAILDEGYVCHVGFPFGGHTTVIPMAYWRDGDHLYIHGATSSRIIQTLQSGVEACVAVTHLDGLVMARSAFHHSMNYRSVVLYGVAETVPDDEKVARLDRFMDIIEPGRRRRLRPHHDKEIKATAVLRFALDQASAKIRTGGPVDDPEDMSADVWAGVIPLALTRGDAIADQS